MVIYKKVMLCYV